MSAPTSAALLHGVDAGVHLVLAPDAPLYTLRHVGGVLPAGPAQPAHPLAGVVGNSVLDVLPVALTGVPCARCRRRLLAALDRALDTGVPQFLTLPSGRLARPRVDPPAVAPRAPRRAPAHWHVCTVPLFADEARVGGVLLTLAPAVDGRPDPCADADVRARRAAELAALIESMPDAVYIGTADGLTAANAAALAQFGYPSLAALNRRLPVVAAGLRYEDAATGVRLPAGRIPFARALAGEASVSEVLVRRAHSHRARRLRVSAAPVRHHGRVIGAVAVSTDVTAERAAEAALRHASGEARTALRLAAEAQERAEQANQAKGAFLTAMSHELRTPLNAIAGYAQLMELGLRGPVTAAQAEDLARIQRAQAHLLGLVNAVLNFAKLEAGQVRYALADVDLDAIADEVDAIMAPLMAAKGVRYHRAPVAAVDGRAVVVHADAEKVRQVLLNLLTNAVKATTAGGTITMACDGVDPRAAAESDAAAMASVHVTDTGTGIGADQLTRVFDPFVQVGRGLTSCDGGVGLGLSISRDLARGMGGELSAVSVLGAGSTFTLTLPRGGARDAA